MADFKDTKVSEMEDAYRSIAIDHINDISTTHIDTANKLYTEANETERSLSGQLTLLNTVILTSSLIALGNEKLFSQLTDAHKVLIFSVILLQIFSILSGIKSYQEMEKFYISSGDVSRRSAEIAQSRGKEYDTINELEAKVGTNDASSPDASSKKWVTRQIKALIASLLLFLILVALLLF